MGVLFCFAGHLVKCRGMIFIMNIPTGSVIPNNMKIKKKMINFNDQFSC